MLGAVELCDNVMQVEASSAEDTSDVSVLYDMADKAVSMATSRQTEQVSFPAAASSFQVRPPPHLRHLLPFLQVSIALPQHLRNTQGTLFLPVVRTCIQCWCYLESRVVGGAVSVKLKSWQNRVILKAVAGQDIERNMLALVKLCTTAGIQPPPPFELRFGYSDVPVHRGFHSDVCTCQVLGIQSSCLLVVRFARALCSA